VTLPIPLSDGQTRIGRYTAEPQVVSAIRNAAAETGARFDVLLASAAMESGVRPDAQASSSSASGMFQFIEQTWLDAVRQYGASHGLAAEASAVVSRNGRLTVEDPTLRQRILDLRNDPRVSSLLAGDSLRAISNQLAPTLGRTPDVAETYLGHFLGAGGAAQMLQALKATPNRPAAELLPAAAAANPAMFTGANGASLTVSQFMDKVRARLARAYSDLGTTMPSGGVTLPGSTPAGRADAPEAAATGWGSSNPRRTASAPEQMMLSTLAEVFSRVDRGLQDRRDRHQTHNQGLSNAALPSGVLSALQGA
jgi:hypothetical protein